MPSRQEIQERLERLFVSTAQFEQNGGEKHPGLRAKLAERCLKAEHLESALKEIVGAEDDMREHKLRELAMKIPRHEALAFQKVLTAIALKDYGRAEEILIASGVLDD